jgi:hypothetical protein
MTKQNERPGSSGSGDSEDEQVDDWEASLDAFFAWYVSNMFGSVNQVSLSSGDSLVYSLAKLYNVTAPTIDKVKKRFDTFDTDGSGNIEYNEFLQMLLVLLGARTVEDISEKRIYRFWKEIDRDSSGSISFPEFCGWFLQNFKENETGIDTHAIDSGPVGNFYSSYNPQVQRRNSQQEALENAASALAGELEGTRAQSLLRRASFEGR